MQNLVIIDILLFNSSFTTKLCKCIVPRFYNGSSKVENESVGEKNAKA